MPATLVTDTNSRYSALQRSEKKIQRKLYENKLWRHWVMEQGRLTERNRQ